MALKSKICNFRVKQSKMAPKIQDDGRFFFVPPDHKVRYSSKELPYKNWCLQQSVTG